MLGGLLLGSQLPAWVLQIYASEQKVMYVLVYTYQ